MTAQPSVCPHDGDTWFDRSVCPEPCGAMHDRCTACGAAVGGCPVADQGEAAEPADSLRERYAEVLRRVADERIVAEWICCEPVKPGHKLCGKGAAAREMVRALLSDEGAYPSHVLDALMAVRDAEVAGLRAQVSAARLFAVEMRGYCSPHGVSALYADRLDAALDAAAARLVVQPDADGSGR